MDAYATTARVDEHGQVNLATVPFAPGTEVEVTIKPTTRPAKDAPPLDRSERLFAAFDKARNTESIGPLRREELYDRKVLR
jgi:hypothetical protein